MIIIGASRDRKKYGNKAVRAYLSRGYKLYPVNPHSQEIEGIRCYSSLKEVSKEIAGKCETATIYLPPEKSINMIDQLKACGVKKVILNPNTHSPVLIKGLKANGIKVILACAIRYIGLKPEDFSDE